MKRAQKRWLKVWRRKVRRTKATIRAARLGANRNPLAARGKYPFPLEARNFVCRGECRVWIACSGRRAIHHNITALLQKKATEKWYRTVRIKNLTEGSDAHSACSAPASEHAGIAQEAGKRAPARGKQNAPDEVRSVLAKFKMQRKKVFATAWQRAAETSRARVLPRRASPVWLLQP